MSYKSKQAGFTLVELLLAMTLFSLTMIVATAGFIGMNRVFTRGLVRKDLSEAAQFITEDITRALRAEGLSSVATACPETGSTNPPCYNGWASQTLGQTRYIWRSSGAHTGLSRDTGPSTAAPSSSRVSLLSDKYKVKALTISKLPTSADLYRVSGVLTTSTQEALSMPADGDPFKITCLGSGQNVAAQSCAVEKFNFVVSTRTRQ